MNVTTLNTSFSTFNTSENVKATQQPKQTEKTGFAQWAKYRLVKAWPTIKNILIGSAVIAAIATVVTGIGVGLAALYIAGYYGVLYAIAIITAMLATPPILIVCLLNNGVGG